MQRLLAIALVAACGGGSDAPAADAPASPPSAEHTLEMLRTYVAARNDPAQLEKLVTPGVISVNGDPTGGNAVFGRDLLVKSRKARLATWKERCTLELGLADAGHGIGVVLCAGTFTGAKTEPKERSRALRFIYEVGVDPSRLISLTTIWWDSTRSYQQLGAELGGDGRIDQPTDKVVTLAARGDATEAKHDTTARALIAALDKRDAAAAERVFGADYVEHNLSAAEPKPSTPADYVRDELAACESSRYRVLGTLAAHDHVAVRFGRTCRVAGKEAYASHVWVLRFEGDRVREGWRADGRGEEARQLGTLDVQTTNAAIRAAGL